MGIDFTVSNRLLPAYYSVICTRINHSVAIVSRQHDNPMATLFSIYMIYRVCQLESDSFKVNLVMGLNARKGQWSV